MINGENPRNLERNLFKESIDSELILTQKRPNYLFHESWRRI
jgi:hypothetical protein